MPAFAKADVIRFIGIADDEAASESTVYWLSWHPGASLVRIPVLRMGVRLG